MEIATFLGYKKVKNKRAYLIPTTTPNDDIF